MTDEQKRALRSVYVAAREAHIAGAYAKEIETVVRLSRHGRQQQRINRAKKRDRGRKLDENQLKDVLKEQLPLPSHNDSQHHGTRS